MAPFRMDSLLVFMNFYSKKKYQSAFYEMCHYGIQGDIIFAQKSVLLAAGFVFCKKYVYSVSATKFKGRRGGRIPEYRIKIFKKIF